MSHGRPVVRDDPRVGVVAHMRLQPAVVFDAVIAQVEPAATLDVWRVSEHEALALQPGCYLPDEVASVHLI